MRPGARAWSVAAAALLAACVSVRPPAPAPAAVGDEIVICGRRFPTGAPVVLWTDPGGYDATRTDLRRSPPPPDLDPLTGLRYTPGRTTRGEEQRVLVPPGSSDLEALAEVVDLFVVHYDVCAVSRRCFEVLHDIRGLSVQFLLDVDGTIYQTLDARETAWHAAQANPRSIGVEIAHPGARPLARAGELDGWYARDPLGPRLVLPASWGDGGVRTPGFVARPARPELVRGTVHGAEYVQHDFTAEQYDSLAKLIAAVCRALPRVNPDAPRDAAGRVRTDALSDAELAAYSGILGHQHVTTRKQDPGPAFDWERVLRAVRARLGAPVSLGAR